MRFPEDSEVLGGGGSPSPSLLCADEIKKAKMVMENAFDECHWLIYHVYLRCGQVAQSSTHLYQSTLCTVQHYVCVVICFNIIHLYWRSLRAGAVVKRGGEQRSIWSSDCRLPCTRFSSEERSEITFAATYQCRFMFCYKTISKIKDLLILF